MPTTEKRAAKTQSDDLVVYWVLLALGVLPFVGRLLAGRWNPSELGLGMAIALFAAHGLVHAYRASRRS